MSHLVLKEWSDKFVYVIVLRAVQFENNWMRKIPRTAKLDEAVGQKQMNMANLPTRSML